MAEISSIGLFLVSGSFFHTKSMKNIKKIANTIKTYSLINSCKGKNPNPTRKLAVQLTATAIDVAAGLAP